MQLHDQYLLYVGPDAYTLVGQSASPQTLTLTRATTALSVQQQELVCYGLFGIISLLKCRSPPDYLIVITKRTKVATVLGSAVYSATDFSVFPLERSSTAELLKQPEEAYLLGLVKSHLYSAPFYFTYGGYNVTSRLQQQEPSDKPLWETADDRFFWNRHLQRRLIDATTGPGQEDYSKFILPVIFGFLEFKPASINGRDFLFGLISRRNRFRAGTRYFSRGIDQEGNVSNFNETEQLVLLNAQGSQPAVGSVRGDVRFSYVQTRGSVPVYWAEINNLRYKPDLKILDLSSTAESLSRHFTQQISLYGDQYLVNLVNSHGYEKPVKEAYERALDAMKEPRVHYTYFDFHKECKGLRFDRVGVLIDGLHDELQQQGYFFHDTSASPAEPQRKQTSVVRTNCMDCLDRTNVVQSALGKWVLNNQLRQVGVLSVKESVEEHPAFLSLFRNVWADNADTVSRAYSGTGALKTDYTRTGKRSKEGALQDGINSVMRYVKNNFLDGPRQDAYDLVTGTWVPRRGEEVAWLAQPKEWAVVAAPWALAAAAGMLVLAAFASNFVGDYIASPTRVSLFALALGAAALHSIAQNGIDYVAQPRLARKTLEEVLGYEGKGFESGRHGRPLKKKLLSVEATAKRTQARKESVLPMLATPQMTKQD
ncbi:Phosphoinositide phosphatase sac1 [Rhodotorula kratochvilovae]